MPWELKHSVIANANRQTVWEFVSDIDNLARVEGDAVESMTLDGPFQAGTRGTTKMRGQEPTHWRLAESGAARASAGGGVKSYSAAISSARE